jgi:hypothetical protein
VINGKAQVNLQLSMARDHNQNSTRKGKERHSPVTCGQFTLVVKFVKNDRVPSTIPGTSSNRALLNISQGSFDVQVFHCMAERIPERGRSRYFQCGINLGPSQLRKGFKKECSEDQTGSKLMSCPLCS